METNLLDFLNEDKKDKKKKSGAASVLDANSNEMKLKPKSGEYITIDYQEFADFLKKNVGRTFTKSSAKKFAEELRKFLGLTTDSEENDKEEKEDEHK